MRNSFFEIFRIDALGKRIFVRVLFVLLIALNLYFIFFPIGDTNFDVYMAWMNKIIESGDYSSITSLDSIPLTKGNYIFLGISLLVGYIDIMASWLYTGVFIRTYRLRKQPNKAISIGKLIFRFIFLSLISAIVLSIFSVFVLYLFLFFIIIFPYLIMFPACYLSGDRSLVGSFRGMFEVTKGYYLTNSRNLSLLLFVYFIFDIILELLANISIATRAAMVPFVNVFLLLALGRYVGIIYIRMLQLPGGFRIIVNPDMSELENMMKKDNDVPTPDEE